MNKIDKALNKFSAKERGTVFALLTRLYEGNLMGMDIEPVKGTQGILRLKKGRLRILFRMRGNAIELVGLGNRSERTYRDL